MPFTVAIVGCPNVGKSTLFNRLIGRRSALVADSPGLTRDCHEEKARLSDLSFRLIDTPGLEAASEHSLSGRMRLSAARALSGADVALFVVDARVGVTAADADMARWVRRQGVPVIPVANKCEGVRAEAGCTEVGALGWGEAVAVSAAHGEGLSDLYQALRVYAPADADDQEPWEPEQLARRAVAEAPTGALRLAIVGRPNVGKSTLVNRLLGEERALTGPEAGVTRDAIAFDLMWRGQPLCLVDTAGLRRRARRIEDLERRVAAETARAVRTAHVVALVLDPDGLLERQDLTIARHALEEGRALVVVVNKWDTVRDPEVRLAQLRERMETTLPQARGVAVVTVSALYDRGIAALPDAAFAASRIWSSRIATAPLNDWLAEALARHPPPLAAGRRVKLRYMTQVAVRPPTFAVFASRPEALPESYIRGLSNALRERFALPGTPLRILIRKGRNPYAPGAKKAS